MATDTKLDSLVINYLTQAQYDNAKSEGTLNSNQIYMTPASSGTHTLPAATSSTLGGVKIGYDQPDKGERDKCFGVYTANNRHQVHTANRKCLDFGWCKNRE